MRQQNRLLFVLAFIALPAALAAQTFRSADTVIKKCGRSAWSSPTPRPLAQVLADSIGPRLSGSPGFASAVDWIERTYTGWGIPVRREKYGTWRGWRHGHGAHGNDRAAHAEPRGRTTRRGVRPRRRTGRSRATWSLIPELADSAAARQWLGTVKGKFVLVSAPEIMCRAQQELDRFARAATVAKINTQRVEAQRIALARLRPFAPANTVSGR